MSFYKRLKPVKARENLINEKTMEQGVKGCKNNYNKRKCAQYIHKLTNIYIKAAYDLFLCSITDELYYPKNFY